MVDTSRETIERNGAETIVDSDQIIWLNEKHVGLDHKSLSVITRKYPSNYRKHRYELVDKMNQNKQPNRFFVNEELVVRVIMDCRKITACKFSTRLGLKQRNVILSKEQPVQTNIISSNQGKSM